MPVLFSARVAKDAQPVEKCEDAYRNRQEADIETCAVSDGAGTFGFSREWSEVMVSWAVEHPPDDFSVDGVRAWFKNSLSTLYEEWVKKIPPYDDLPWYGQNSFQEGSAATLLLLRLSGGRYQALAIGDSCLFHIRDQKLVNAFPIQRSEDFDSFPSLIHTSRGLPIAEHALRFLEGEYQAEDLFLLATDAISAWLLREHESESPAWEQLLELHDDQDLIRLVHDLLAQKKMRNDDVTLLIVRPPVSIAPTSALESDSSGALMTLPAAETASQVGCSRSDTTVQVASETERNSDR